MSISPRCAACGLFAAALLLSPGCRTSQSASPLAGVFSRFKPRSAEPKPDERLPPEPSPPTAWDDYSARSQTGTNPGDQYPPVLIPPRTDTLVPPPVPPASEPFLFEDDLSQRNRGGDTHGASGMRQLETPPRLQRPASLREMFDGWRDRGEKRDDKVRIPFNEPVASESGLRERLMRVVGFECEQPVTLGTPEFPTSAP